MARGIFHVSGGILLTHSEVAAYGLSCPAALGISVPLPGTEPACPALQGRFLTTGHGEAPAPLYLKWVSYWQHIVGSCFLKI